MTCPAGWRRVGPAPDRHITLMSPHVPPHAPACAPLWGQVTGRGKRHHRTTEHLLLRRKIYICLGITRLSAVMLLYLAAGKVQHAAWKACPDSALKHLLATESDPQASRLRGWADVLWWSEAQRGTSPSTALSCTLLGTWEGKKTQSCVLVSRGRKAGTNSDLFKVTQQLRQSLALVP